MGVVNMIQQSQIFLVLVGLVIIGAVQAQDEVNAKDVKAKKSRDPRLFYVSTTSSTTTLLTQTICFMSSTTLGTCKRKRFTDVELQVPLDGAIQPSRTQDLDDAVDKAAPEIAPEIQDSKDVDTKRDARFLVYWLTTTSLSTLTSFTRTVTIGSLACTPSGYTLSVCGK